MNIQSQNCAPIQCTVWPRNGLNLAFEKSENSKVAPLHVESRRFLNSPWLRKSRLNFLVAKVWKLLRHNMGRKVLRKLRRQSASPVYQTHPQSLPSPLPPTIGTTTPHPVHPLTTPSPNLSVRGAGWVYDGKKKVK